MTAERTFRVIEVMPLAAHGTGDLRQVFLFTAEVRGVRALEKFEFPAVGTRVNGNGHRTRDQIRQISQNPSRLSKLQLSVTDVVHRDTTA